VPFLSWVIADDDQHSSTRTRISLHFPGVTWELDTTDILEAAGRRARQVRRTESRTAGVAGTLSVLGALLGVLASLVTAGEALEGVGASLIAVLVATGLVTTTAVVTLLFRQERARAQRESPAPPNVVELTERLLRARQTALAQLRPEHVDE
jgi:Flp pilus assembly protein TadB